VARGLLDFQHEADSSSRGLISFAGLPGFSIRSRPAGSARPFSAIAGGDRVEDIERLERDGAFGAILRAIEKELLSSAERWSSNIR
jgi:hypothetical protein